MPVQIPNEAFEIQTFRNTNFSAARNPNLREAKSLTNISQSVLGVIPRKSSISDNNNRTSLRAQIYTAGTLGEIVSVIPNKPAFLLVDVFITTLADPSLPNTIFVEESDTDSFTIKQEVKDQDVLQLVNGDAGLYNLSFLPTKPFVRVNLNQAIGEGASDASYAAIILQP